VLIIVLDTFVQEENSMYVTKCITTKKCTEKTEQYT